MAITSKGPRDKIMLCYAGLLGSTLDLTPKEVDLLAEIIKLSDKLEAEASPEIAKKVLLSTSSRKEIQDKLGLSRQCFQGRLSSLENKAALIREAESLVLRPMLKFKPDLHFRFIVDDNEQSSTQGS